MRYNSWVGIKRFFRVINLFLHIFWSFYSLKFKASWHAEGWKEQRREELYVSEARLFRNTAVEMGGLLIKLGQFFSTRVDVFPQSTTRELANLQDEVPSVDFKDMCQVLESEFGKPLHEIYAVIDPIPLASASLGQVHEAELFGGQKVAVKVLRPGIEKRIDIDLRAVRQVIVWIKFFTDWQQWVDFDAIYKEFEETLREELNYLQEGKNAETIAANSADDDELIVPRIYWEFTRQRVLTMEFVDGFKVTDYEELEKAGISRSKLARRLLEIYVKQILVDGFFHADPHPGNLFIGPSGKVIMIDFGMVGTISPELKEKLIKMVLAMVDRDNIQVVYYLKQVGFLRRDADDTLIARAVGVFLEQLLGNGTDLFENDLKDLLDDLEEILYEQPFQIPARFTFLGRALGTLYGICIGLDKDISFLDAGKPYLKQFMPEEARPLKLLKDKAVVLGSSLIEVPPLLAKVLRQAERGDLELKLPLKSLQETVEQNTRASLAIAWGIVWASVILSTVYLYVNGNMIEARWGLGAAIITGLIFIGKTRNNDRKRVLRHPEGIKKIR
ncbi:MAG TPA: AarF/ABC1/UbiB kinase family protein [Syntrophomonas sp.]|nr:AarF/ABC1/UbiB kinase family protein [Syntrophomonas sp.]